MKKLILIAATLMLAFSTTSTIAQKFGQKNKEETQQAKEEKKGDPKSPQEMVKEMEDRREKMEKHHANRPTTFDELVVEAFVAHVYMATALAMENSAQLTDYYYRSMGLDPQGNPSPKVKLPTPNELTALKDRLAKQAKHSEEATRLSILAMECAKAQKNPLRSAKIIAAMLPATRLTTILAEETIAQAKLIPIIVKNINDRRK